MNIPHHLSRRLVWGAVALGLVVAASAGAYLLWPRSPQPTPTNQPPHAATPAQKASEQQHNATSKQQFNDSAVQRAAGQPAGQQQPRPAPTNQQIELRAETAGQAVTVYTKLAHASSGTCSLRIRNGEREQQQTAAIIYQPEFSSCAGFSIPVAPLGQGQWQIELTVTTDGATLTKTITHKVA